MIERVRPEVEDSGVEGLEGKTGAAGTLPKGRYLLFDAGCMACMTIAGLVERETQGWLTARGLGEPEVRAALSKARPDWKHEPTFLEVEGEKVVASTGLAMRARMLVGLGPRKAARVAKIAGGKGVRGIEMTLTATEEDPNRYEVGSTKLLDRRAALKTMGALGLAAALLPGLPAGAFAQSGAGSDAPVAARDVRVRTVRLSFRETMRRFGKMRGEDNRLRMLHKNMTDKGFRLVRDGSVGLLSEVVAGGNDAASIRALNVRLRYKKNGQTAIFAGGAELVKAGDTEIMDRIRSDYTVKTGRRLDTFGMKDGQVQNVQRIDDWVKERKSLIRRGQEVQGRGSREASKEVSARVSACGVCIVAGDIIYGTGCGLYYSALQYIACGTFTAPPAIILCATIATVLTEIICGTSGALIAPQACENAGYC